VSDRTVARAEPVDPADVDLLREMVRIRRFEERCVELYSSTKIRGFMHLYIGEEAVAVGVLSCLGPDDAVVATYREHGHALTRGVTARSIMAEMFGKVDGCSRGRGGSMHLFDAATRFYGGNAIVGGGLPVAVGLALADRLQGRDRVTACFFGEGAVAEGEFHESLNLAALWQLPVLFCCENNLYAMGTALELSESQPSLALKAAAYEVPAWTVDGMDVLAVRRAAAMAVEATRAGGTSSSCRPTATAPTRCTTLSDTATRRRSPVGASATRSTRWWPGSGRPTCSVTTTSPASRRRCRPRSTTPSPSPRRPRRNRWPS
jgi:pyruvate dehydrogenase E1 component alpha subunit